jgi:hypothetical protein
MVKDAASISQKQVTRAVAASSDYAAGVQNPETSWKAATLKADAKRKAALAASEAEGRWAKRVGQTSEEDWKNKAATVGAARFGPGVEANKDKIDKFWAVQQPKIASLQSQVKAMPEATEEQRKARLLANFEGMKKTGY